MSKLIACLTALLTAFVSGACAQENEKRPILDPDQAGPDFAIQGEYTGEVTAPDGNRMKLGVQVVARGEGRFDVVGYVGGLPGDGWDRRRMDPASGELRDGAVEVGPPGGQWKATIRDGAITITTAGGTEVGKLERVVRKSPTLGQKPPPGAVVLFDGTSLEEWQQGRMSEDGLLMQGARSKRAFGSCTLHMEFMAPYMPYARGQDRGNSGAYVHGCYEIQILDSLGEPERMGDCGGIYSMKAPDENMCFPPLSWQTFDIDLTAAAYDEQGNKIRNARMTVRHNGVVIHDNVELPQACPGGIAKEGPEPGALFIQDHGNPLRFRNIWVVEKEEEPVTAGLQQPIKVMIIGGQNNHNWQASTPFLEQLLAKAPHIQPTVYNAPGQGAAAAEWDAWQPDFRAYDCILLDYNGEMWPERVRQGFVRYVEEGGGVLVLHAANNAFTGWKEYERMVGLLWRAPDYGYSLYVDDDGNVVREEPGEGRGMGHGSQYDWVMTVTDPDNPITADMPAQWLHVHDELYHGQRGPAEDVHILLTAYSDPAPGRNGTGVNEPIVWWVPYGQGKVVTDLMGHVGELDALQCAGFQTVLLRCCEWLATGRCVTPMPDDFPTAEQTSVRG